MNEIKHDVKVAYKYQQKKRTFVTGTEYWARVYVCVKIELN